MNIEAENHSVSRLSPTTCITIESDEEIEIITLDSENEDDENTRSFQEKGVSNTFIDVSNTSYDLENEPRREDANFPPANDPLITDEPDEINKSNETDENGDVKKRRSRLSLCAVNCHLKISEEDQKGIFDMFWSKKTLRSKFQFLDRLIVSQLKTNGRRQCSKFYLDLKPQRQNICKLCFLCGLNLTQKFLSLYFHDKYRKEAPKKTHEIQDLLTEFEVLEAQRKPKNDISIDEEEKLPDKYLRETKLQLGWNRIPPCANECSARISKEDQKSIFLSYWFKEKKDSRFKFICDMTEISYNQGKKSISYYVHTQLGIQNVCKSCFCTMINESSTFIHKAIKLKCLKMKLPDELHSTEPQSITSSKEVIELDSETRNTNLKNNANFKKKKEKATDYAKDVEIDDSVIVLNTFSEKETSQETFNQNNENNEDITNKSSDTENISDKELTDIFETLKDLKYNSIDKYLEDKYKLRQSSCLYECNSQISKEVYKTIFCSYWQKNQLTKRFNFISDLIEFKKQSFIFKDIRRACKYPNFYLKTDKGSKRVCKNCLISILDISARFLDIIIEDKYQKLKENVTSVQGNTESVSAMCEEVITTEIPETLEESNLNFIKKKLVQGFQRFQPCKENCFFRVSEEDQERVFYSYWRGSTPESRCKFICDMTEIVKSTCRTRMLFYVQTSKGKELVCKKCFRTAINDSYKFIVHALEQKNILNSQDEMKTPRLGTLEIPQTSVENYGLVLYNELMAQWEPLKPCRSGCHYLFSENQQKDIFESYWKDSTLKSRKNFISRMTELKPTQSYLLNFNYIGKRYLSYYHLQTTATVQVCKECFCNVILENPRFIKQVLDEKFSQLMTQSLVENIENNDIEINDSDSQDDKSENEDPLLIQVNTINGQENSMNISDGQCICETKSVNGKKWTPLLSCINSCHLKISEVEQVQIFTSYWQKTTFHARFTFVNETTDLILQEKNDNAYNILRFRTRFYLTAKEYRHNVCKQCFYHILDVSKAFVAAVFNQKLFNMLKRNTCWLKDNSQFFIFDDDNLKPQSSALNEVDDKTTCENCVSICGIKFKQGVPRLISCKYACYSKVSENDIKRIYHGYWKEKSIEEREKFICDMVSSGSVRLHAERNIQIDGEQIRTNFCLHTEKGTVSFCESCFCTIIRESFDFIEMVIKRKWNKLKVWMEPKNKMLDEEKTIYQNETSLLESNSNEVDEPVQIFLPENIFVKQEVEFETPKLDIGTVQEINKEANSSNDCSEHQEHQEGNITITYIPGSEIKREDTEMIERNLSHNFFIIKDLRPSLESEQGINLSNKDENSKSASNKEPETTQLSLKRKLDETNSEEMIPLPIEMSIIKEEIHLENYVEFEAEENENPPSKIAKCSFPLEPKLEPHTDDNEVSNSDKELIIADSLSSSAEDPFESSEKTVLQGNHNLETPTIKVSPKNKVSIKQKNRMEDTPLKKNQQKETKRTRKSTTLKNKTLNSTEKNCEEKGRKLRSALDQKLQDEETIEMLLQKYRRTIIRTAVQKNDTDKAKERNELLSCEMQVLSLTEEQTKEIKEHIQKFPLCESYHYNGKKSEKYLPMGLTSNIMYDLYKNEVTNPVSHVWYKKILEKTDLKFKISFLTKCDICNAAAVQYKLAQDSSERGKINSQRTAHLVDSEEANNSKSLDEKTTIFDKSVYVCSFAFQQSLPTPYLKVPISYYKQRLWTYNFTLQKYTRSINTKVRNCYMWNETEGKRSANEIASCLYEYLKNLPPKITTIIFYSNSCNGESRSKTLSSMFLYLLANHETLQKIEHKFLISGHSPIEENLGSNYVQEIMKNHHGKIHQPSDWYEAFESSAEQERTEIKRPETFYDFDSIREEIFGGGDSVIEKGVKWLQYTKEGVYYKNGWSSSNRLQVMKLEGSTSLKDLSNIQLRNPEKASITEEKKKDLLELLTFLKPQARGFYGDLLENEAIENHTSMNNKSNSKIQEKHETTSSSMEIKGEEIYTQDTMNLSNQISPLNRKSQKRKCEDQENPKLPNKSPNKSNEFEIVVVKEEKLEQK